MRSLAIYAFLRVLLAIFVFHDIRARYLTLTGAVEERHVTHRDNRFVEKIGGSNNIHLPFVGPTLPPPPSPLTLSAFFPDLIDAAVAVNAHQYKGAVAPQSTWEIVSYPDHQAGRQEAGRHPSSVSYEMSDLGGGQKQIIKRSALHFLRKDDPLRDVVV